MTDICTATKRNGSPCTLPSSGASGLCWAHDLKNAERRRRGQSRGGKSKPTKELLDIKRSIHEVIEEVRDESIERAVGAVVFQGYNTLLKALETARRIRETEELEERLSSLEEVMERKREGGQWGSRRG